MQILTGSMISVVICMAAFVWMKKHPGNADFRVLYLISLNLEEFFAARFSGANISIYLIAYPRFPFPGTSSYDTGNFAA